MKKGYIVLLLLFMCCNVKAQNPAERDPSFNPYPLPLDNYFVNSEDDHPIKLQPDGKVLMIEENPARFIRLDNNLLDSSFNVTDAQFIESINTFEVQPNGKIIVGGSFTTYNGVNANHIIRLNPDGSRDITFDVTFSFMFTGGVKQVIIYPDGKILVATVGSSNSYAQKIIRLNNDGSVDATFNMLTVTINASSDIISPDITLQADRKIILSGNFNTINGIAANDIVRLNENGSIDAGFTTGAGFNYDVSKVCPQNDGKILVSGNFSTYNGVAVKKIVRLNSDGSLDPVFVISLSFALNIPINGMALQPDGKIVAYGDITGGTYPYRGRKIRRLNTDGTQDDTFNTGSGFDGIVSHLIQKPDGKLMFSGDFKQFNDFTVNGVVVLNADGSRDFSFDNRGAGVNAAFYCMAVGADQKIYIGGTHISSYNGFSQKKVIRLNQDGTPDTSFNIGTGFSDPGDIKSLKPQTDGKLLVGGFFSSFGTRSVRCIVRLNADGTRDTGFSITPIAGLGLESSIVSIDTQADGKIIISSGYWVKRLHANGTLDNSFAGIGLQTPSFDKVVVLPDDKIMVLGGSVSSSSVFSKGIARLNANGTIDTSFVLDAAIPASLYIDMVCQPDGKVIILNYNKLTRLNSNGSIDQGFNYTIPSLITLASMVLLPDGKLIVSGVAQGYNGYLQRLHTNGSVDEAFVPNVLYKAGAQVALQSGGKIIAIGGFTTYNNLPERRILRLTGETYYYLQGTNRYDANNNGCDATDSTFPNLKLAITGPENSSYVTNTSGNYFFGTTAGHYTFTPVFENPDYFIASPSSLAVNFTGETLPQIQNFCITPNGNHPDLEITLLPVTVARPGFDAAYKLVYKNKGNQLQSGTVTLNFNDAILDVVSASPPVSSQVLNLLTWDFSNLNPFETREISLLLNLNSPVEIPAANDGDRLVFTAKVNGLQNDETPSDNTFTSNQQVVNSFDPNDKTCLEGNNVTREQVGKYVHYLIRFENKGTYTAQNITVSDIIDTSKFDISSLVPLNGSHSFVTKTTQDNKVDFIFNNINLDFHDHANDGYVAFKIKTNATLDYGDTFSNTASIYFDYNAPIHTNLELTTISELLGTEDFVFENHFSVYPNPASDVLNIYNKKEIDIQSIAIYNLSGQLVLHVPNAKKHPVC